MKTAGVYVLENAVAGTVYAGSTSNPEHRKHDHFKRLRQQQHSKKLQATYDVDLRE
jgi:predicted GIY-YIG superfamily endonuclease